MKGTIEPSIFERKNRKIEQIVNTSIMQQENIGTTNKTKFEV